MSQSPVENPEDKALPGTLIQPVSDTLNYDEHSDHHQHHHYQHRYSLSYAPASLVEVRFHSIKRKH